MDFFVAPIFVFICFFILFSLTRRDFVLIRQNISLTQIFNLALISIFLAFVAGRFFFVINSFDWNLLHLIRFFYFTKFPGTSTLGFFVGGALSILFFQKKSKALARIFDIFVLSFLPVYSFNIIFRSYPVDFIAIPIILFFVSWILFFAFLDIHNHYRMKDGKISLLVFVVLSLDSFLLQIWSQDAYRIIFGLSFLQIVSLIIGIASLSAFVLRRK